MGSLRFWLTAFSVGLIFFLAFPLWVALVMGAILSALFFPIQVFLEKKKIPKALSAGGLTLAVAVLIIFPTASLIYLGARATFEQVEKFQNSTQSAQDLIQEFLSKPKVQKLLDWTSQTFSMDIQELYAAAQDLLKAMGVKVADLLGAFFASLPSITMGILVTVLSIYFFLAEGPILTKWIRRVMALPKTEMDKLSQTFVVMSRSVILASVVSGLAQAFLFGVTCLILGIEKAPTISVLVFVASFIPLIGSAPITVIVALLQLLSDHQAIGTALLVVAALVSVVDNVVRPLFLKGAANLHPLVAFLAAFGGLQLFGVPGIFVGPVVIGLVLTWLEIHANSTSHT